MKLIKKNLLTFCSSNKITLINCTNNGEDLLISDKVLLLNDMKTIFYGDKRTIKWKHDSTIYWYKSSIYCRDVSKFSSLWYSQ